MRFQPALKLTRTRQFSDYLEGKFSFPLLVEISPTGRCNAVCPWCFYKEERDTTDIELGPLELALSEMKDVGVKAINWTGGGDPTLYPKFWRVTQYARQLGLKQGLFTNALKIDQYDPRVFEWIRVSKTNYPFPEENLAQLRNLTRARTLGLTINYSGDDKEVVETLDLAHRLGIDYVQVRPALNLKGKLTQIEPPSIKRHSLIISDYKFQEAGKPISYSVCEGYHFVPFIWQDGEVNVCAYQRGKNPYVLGNINKEQFTRIMMKAPKTVPVNENCQVCCKNNEINQTISETRKLEDVEFI